MIPAANHNRRHAKIVGYGLDGISLMNLISGNTAGVGRLFARRVVSGGDRNHQAAFGLKVGLDFEIVGLGDGMWRGVMITWNGGVAVASGNLGGAPAKHPVLAGSPHVSS